MKTAEDRRTKGQALFSKNATVDTDIANLRENLLHEQETVDRYQRHIAETDRPNIKTLLAHIMAEEVSHIRELTEQLENIDKPVELAGKEKT